MEEGTSRQGSRTNNAAQTKTWKGLISVSDDEECDTEIPLAIDNPRAPKGQSEKKESVSSPTPISPQHLISDSTFNNGVEEGTSGQSSRTNNTAQTKTKTKAISLAE